MKDVKKADIKEIEKFIVSKRAELQKFRFGTSGASTKNVKAAHNLKKDIARAMTEISARKISAKVAKTK